MSLAPVTLFVYNRPKHARRTVDALLKNRLAGGSDLIIFSDAAKTEADRAKVDEVRKYVKSISGFKNIEIREGKKNSGLAKSIIAGVTETVNAYGKIIVLEDDLVTSPHFLEYLNDALDRYEQATEVISISAYAYPLKAKLPETFFLKGAECWGWATWKRGWDLFEKDGQKLLNEITDKKLDKAFDLENSYPYTQMLRDQLAGKIDSWAIRWHALAFIKNKLTLYPRKSLTLNIGFDRTGTHCNAADKYATAMSDKKINVGQIPIQESAKARKALIKFHKKPFILFRAAKKIKRYFNRI